MLKYRGWKPFFWREADGVGNGDGSDGRVHPEATISPGLIEIGNEKDVYKEIIPIMNNSIGRTGRRGVVGADVEYEAWPGVDSH